MKLLNMLVRTPGQTVPRQTLLKDVWQYNETSDTRTVDSHVRRLRSKLGPLATYVETVQGVRLPSGRAGGGRFLKGQISWTDIRPPFACCSAASY